MVAEKIKSLLPDQLKYFDRENTYATRTAFFDPNSFVNSPDSEDEEIRAGIAIDLGGSRLSWTSFQRISGRVILLGETVLKNSQMGRDYLKWLEDLSGKVGTLPVGISSTGSVEGTSLRRTNNLPTFKEELDRVYQGDFANLFSRSLRLTVLNDAVAGTMGTLYDLFLTGRLAPDVKQAIYLINGTGINAAIWNQHTIWSTELGAVNIDPQLAESMELEEETPQVRPVASGTGIATRWKNKTGETLTGEEIAERFLNGHPLATRLYNDSAFVAAHVVAGLSESFGLFEDKDSTLLVCHGGIFSVPGYAERLREYLKNHFGLTPKMETGGNHRYNPGLKGAALAILSGYIL